MSEAFKVAATMADLPGLVANLTLNISSWAPPRSFSYTPTPPTPAPTTIPNAPVTTSSEDASKGHDGHGPLLSLRVLLVVVGVGGAAVLLAASLLVRRRFAKLKVIPKG